MTDIPTQAPTDSAVPPGPAQGEPAGVSEAARYRLGLYLWDPVLLDVETHPPCAGNQIVVLARDYDAARQELAATRTHLAELQQFREWAAPQIVTHGEDQLQILALTQQIADSAREVERLNAANAAMRGVLVNDVHELLARAKIPGKTYLYCLKPAEINAALASPSQPERGKCETCNGRQRILQPISKTARNPVKPDELVRVQTFVRCPDCAQPERQGVTFYRCTFEGNPPAPHSNWLDWADSRMYTNVLIMAHEFGLPVPDEFKEKQPEPSLALREAAKAGAQAIRASHPSWSPEQHKAALLDAFAEGK